MGMPSVIVAFRERGITAIKRSQRGIVALILKEDAKAPLTDNFIVYTVDDIPAGLSDANKEQIELACIGYQTTPKHVYVQIQDKTAADYADSLKKLENVRFDYLVIPELKPEEAQTVATWIKGMRDNKDKKVKAVLPNTPADSEGVVNFTTAEIVTAKKTYKTAEYCSRIAGLIAGTPMTISCTYAPLPEVLSVPTFTRDEMDKKVDAGEFFLFNDGEKIKVARGVNSYVTTVQDKGQSFKKIKLVDLMDMIHDDIVKTGQDSYLGKYANSYDNRCLLISAIQGYMDGLELDGLLEKDQNSVGIDLEQTKVWLESNGKKTKAQLATAKDQDVKTANVGDNVFLAAEISPLDAIENIKLVCKF